MRHGRRRDPGPPAAGRRFVGRQRVSREPGLWVIDPEITVSTRIVIVNSHIVKSRAQRQPLA